MSSLKITGNIDSKCLVVCERDLSNIVVPEFFEISCFVFLFADPVNVVRFLRGCKFDLEKTKHKLSNYYELRARCPEWFSQRDPCLPEIQELLRLG
jgi:hypothetical protein